MRGNCCRLSSGHREETGGGKKQKHEGSCLHVRNTLRGAEKEINKKEEIKQIKRTSGRLPTPHEFKYRTGERSCFAIRAYQKQRPADASWDLFGKQGFSSQPLANYKASSGLRNTKPKQNSAHKERQPRMALYASTQTKLPM